MVTATTSEAKPTKTVKRPWLLQLQVRNLLSRTTNISMGSLERIADKGIGNRWLHKVSVYGFDLCNRCHVGLSLEIDWLTHTIAVVLLGEEVTFNKTVCTDDCAPEVENAIEVFNQVVKVEHLWAEWRVAYAEGVDVAQVRQELGLSAAQSIAWAGTVFKLAFGVSELKELKVRLLIAQSDELDVVGPQLSEMQREKPATASLIERIKQALG